MRLIAIPAAFLAGALVSRWLLAHAPARWSVDLAQPLAVATNWGGFGALLWIVLAATLAVACIPYVRTLAGPAPTRGAVILSSALALAAAFAWAPLFSSDVYAYAAYGEMARLGTNPYVHLTHASSDPIIAAAQWQWGGIFPMCVYGSGFVALAAAVTYVTHFFGTFAPLAVLRVLSCLALLACALLLSLWSTRAAWFLALNPLAIWVAAEGHNDTLALAAVLAGFAIARKQHAIGAAIVASAAAIKLTALGASMALAAHAGIARARAMPVLAGTIAGVAIALVGSWQLIAGLRGDLAPHGRYLPLASVQALGIPMAIAAAMLVLARIPTLRAPIDRWCIVAFALWIAIPNPYPWYAIWLLAPAALAVDSRVQTTALALAAASLLRYLPDAVAPPGGILSLLLGLGAFAAFAPLALRPKNSVV